MDIDLTGFSCRFQDVETTKDESMALIVKIKTPDKKQIYKNIINKIHEMYGNVENWHPAQVKNLNIVSPFDKSVDIEAKVTMKNIPYIIRKFMIFLMIILARTITKLPFKTGIKINYQDIRDLKVMENVSSDFKKLENSIKLVISTTLKEKQKLLDFLNELEKQNLINYGYYSDKKVHFICSVYTNHKQDVHFIDVINGGFTKAATMLKEKQIAFNNP